MISIVVVYNDERVFKEVLLAGLKRQNAGYELIALPNTDGRFKSAAEALNFGGSGATGKYIMFVHQDVELGCDSWLEKVEDALDSTPDVGVAGAAGVREKNGHAQLRGYIRDSGGVWGAPIDKLEEVDTLDECLLIIPKAVFKKLSFDEKTFDDWHCYGIDYCLSVSQSGLKAYALPFFVHHRSPRTNFRDLLKYQKRLYEKHKRNHRRIYTTCGVITRFWLRLWSVISPLTGLHRWIAPSWVEYLREELSGCESVLDLGCGYSSPLQHCGVAFSVGVELDESYLEESRKKKIHNEYIKADVRKVDFEPRNFDAVLCLRVIEHLTKQEGRELMEKMEKWARKKVVLTTGRKPYWHEILGGESKEHKSIWTANELRGLGYNVRGMAGWGYDGIVRYGPYSSRRMVLDLFQRIILYFPKLAYQMFATKRLQG
jgi:SAM-dependent methyltransferase